MRFTGSVGRSIGAVGTGLVITTLTLSGCGGGGSGSSGGSGAAPPVSSPPQASPSVALQRSTAQATLSAVGASAIDVEFASASSPSGLAFRRGVANALRHIETASSCQNGIIESVTATSPTAETITIDAFYDAACTVKWRHLTVDLTAASSTSGTANGTETTYSRSGSVIDYETLALTVAQPSNTQFNFSATVTDAPEATASPIGSAGVTCNVTGAADATGGTAVCGSGAVGNVPSLSEELGGTLNIQVTGTATSGGGAAFNLSGSATEYTVRSTG